MSSALPVGTAPPAAAPARGGSLGPRRSALALAAALLLSLLAYWPSLGGEFVYDDHPLLVESDCHHSLRRLAQRLALRGGGICSERPLRFASFALDYALWGNRPLGYHLTNVALHGLCGWLALLVLLRLTRDRRLALIGAGLFLLHPIATEAVAYVSGRRDLLMALFSLLAVLLFEDYRERGGLWRLPLLLLAQAAALLSHETAAALPILLLCLEASRGWSAGRGLRRLLALGDPARRRAGATLLLLFLLAGSFALWTVRLHNFSERTRLWGPTLAAHIGTVLRVHAHYLHQLVLPTNLIADYTPDAFPVSSSLLEPRALGALLLVAGLLVLAGMALSRAPLLAAAILGYFALLLPSSQIVVHHELLAEHRLYLPALCYCALLAAAARAALRLSRWTWGLVAALGVCGVLLCWSRSLDWTSSERLWTVTVAQVPRSSRAQANLGVVFARQGRFLEARAHLETALGIRPDFCDAQLAHARLLIDLQQPELALPELRRAAACRAAPRFLEALASAALRFGDAREAERNFRRVLALRPEDPDLRTGLARALYRQGKLEAAVRELGLALQARPGWEEGRRLLGAIQRERSGGLKR